MLTLKIPALTVEEFWRIISSNLLQEVKEDPVGIVEDIVEGHLSFFSKDREEEDIDKVYKAVSEVFTYSLNTGLPNTYIVICRQGYGVLVSYSSKMILTKKCIDEMVEG